MYDISIDRARQLMIVKVSGFWKADTFKGYAAEAARAADQLRQAGGFKVLLIDMSEFPIQSKEVAEMHGRLLIAAQEQYRVKAAVVMKSALSRLQAGRVAKLTGSQLFDDADAALDVLMK